MYFNHKFKKLICFSLLYTILFINSSTIYTFANNINNESIINTTHSENESKPEKPKDTLELSAKTAVLIDAKTGIVLYDKNKDEKIYPASTTKIMTAILAIENLKSTDTIEHSHNAIYNIGPGSSNIGMSENETLTLDEALHAILLESANEVCMAVAEKISGSVEEFSKLMNKRAKELGAKNTNFVNPHGFHDDNHYTTSYDMALIMQEAIKIPKFVDIIKTDKYTIAKTNLRENIPLYNSNRFIKSESPYFYEYVVGSKTGFTNEAGNTLATYAKKGDMELISVVMKSKGVQTYVDSKKMLEKGFTMFMEKTVFLKENYESKEPVVQIYEKEKILLGDAYISAKNNVSLNVPKSLDLAKISKDIKIDTPIKAPINVGDKVGNINILYNNKVLSSVDVISSDKIEPIPEKKLENKKLFKKIINIFIKTIIYIVTILFLLLILIFTTRTISKIRRKKRRKKRYQSKYNTIIPMDKKRKRRR